MQHGVGERRWCRQGLAVEEDDVVGENQGDAAGGMLWRTVLGDEGDACVHDGVMNASTRPTEGVTEVLVEALGEGWKGHHEGRTRGV